MLPTLTSTTFDIAGYDVVNNLGVVRGVIVRSRSVLGNFAAGLQQIMGGNITILSKLCEDARAHAYDLMLQHAEQVGANAVIGIRYDANEVMEGAAEVLCYGTAVVVQKRE